MIVKFNVQVCVPRDEAARMGLTVREVNTGLLYDEDSKNREEAAIAAWAIKEFKGKSIKDESVYGVVDTSIITMIAPVNQAKQREQAPPPAAEKAPKKEEKEEVKEQAPRKPQAKK